MGSIRVSETTKKKFDRLKYELSLKRHRHVSGNDLVKELLKCYKNQEEKT